MGLFKCCCRGETTPPPCCPGSWTPPTITVPGYTSAGGWGVLAGCCSNQFFTPNSPVEDYTCSDAYRSRKVTSYCLSRSYYTDIPRIGVSAIGCCPDSPGFVYGTPCVGTIKVCNTIEYTAEVTKEKKRWSRTKELSREVRITKVNILCDGVARCAYLLTVKIHKQIRILSFEQVTSVETQVIGSGCCSVENKAAGTYVYTQMFPNVPTGTCKEKFDYVDGQDPAAWAVYGMPGPTKTTVNYDIVKSVILTSLPTGSFSTSMGTSDSTTCVITDTMPGACPITSDTPGTTCFSVGIGSQFPSCNEPVFNDIGVAVGVACKYVAYKTIGCGTVNWLVAGPHSTAGCPSPPWPTVVFRTYNTKQLDIDSPAPDCFVCNQSNQTWRTNPAGDCDDTASCPCHWNAGGWCCDMTAAGAYLLANQAGFCYDGGIVGGVVTALSTCSAPKGQVVVPKSIEAYSQTVVFATDTAQTTICVTNNQSFAINFPT